MKIEEFLINPEKAYIKSERYLNDGSRSGIKNTTSFETSPLSSIDNFELIAIEFEEIIPIGLEEDFFLPHNVMLIHPDLKESELIKSTFAFADNSNVKVSPTASGRTTYCYKYDIFIKLAYFEILGRISRHIGMDKIQSAAEVTRMLKSIIDKNLCNPAFAILKEDMGKIASITTSNKEVYELGVIFREGKPYPLVSNFLSIIPFFSLFSKEYVPDSDWIIKEHQDDPLIIQLFKKQTEYNSIYDFTLNKIIKPLYHTYFDALIFGGIELEAHAQNMLISINKNFEIVQIVCRDLESAGRDISLMREKGLEFKELAKTYKYIEKTNALYGELYSSYQRTHSFMFDFKLGEYITSPIIECIYKFDSTIIKEKMYQEIKTFNKQFISQLPIDYFPNQWCDYDNLVWEDKSEKKYNWYDCPKYREV